MKNIVNERKIEILKKYFPLDEETKTFTIKMYYEKASDLLDYSIGELTHEMFKDEFIEKLSENLEMLPFDYKADVILDIKDYDVYNEEMILEKFNDLLEIWSFKVVKDTKKKNLHAFIITFIGILVFIFNILVGAVKIFGEGLMSSIIGETLSIISTVFIWEAVGEVFLSPSEDSKCIMNIVHYVNSFSISKDGEIKASESREGIISNCKTDLMASNGRRNLLMITSIVLTYLGGIGITQCLVEAFTKDLNVLPGGIGGYVASITLSIILLLLGVSGILTFTNKKRNTKLYVPYTIVAGVFALASIVVSLIVQDEIFNTIGHVIGLTFIVIYFFIFRQKQIKK